jgi:hypothetical protein
MKTKIRLLIETEQLVLVQDMDENGCASITNNAEAVVEWVLARQADKIPEILYVDTDGRVDELNYGLNDRKFAGFSFRFGSLPEFQKKRGIPVDGIAVYTVGLEEKDLESELRIVLPPYNNMTKEQKENYMVAAVVSPEIALALLCALEFPNHSVVIRPEDIALATSKDEAFPERALPEETDPQLALLLYERLGQEGRKP